MPPELRGPFLTRIGIAENDARLSNVATTRTAKDSAFSKWCTYMQKHNMPINLQGLNEPIRQFQAFAVAYRLGEITGNRVKSGTVEKALQAIGEAIQRLANLDTDPRLDHRGGLKWQLRALLKAWKSVDPPAERAAPCNITIVRHAIAHGAILWPHNQERFEIIRDLTILAFFFLLRPGEYAKTPANTKKESRSSPFRLCDLTFASERHRSLPAHTAPLNDLEEANFVALTFTDQKNAVKGEQVGHHKTTDPELCPVRTALRLAIQLRHNNAPPETPLFTLYTTNRKGKPITIQIPTNDITLLLRPSARACQHLTGIPPHKISAQSLRSGGATALLCGDIDSTITSLLGRWRSDAMLRYLRVQAASSTHQFAQIMLDHGAYTFDAKNLDPDFIPLEADDLAQKFAQLPFARPVSVSDSSDTES